MTIEKLTKEQLAKLPVWAQRHFEMLEQALGDAKNEVRTLRAVLGEAPPEGASGLVTWSVLMDDYPLPDRASVRFHEAPKGEKGYHRYIEVGVSSGNQSERVVVVRGSEGIVIQPQASNVVVVRLRKQGIDE